VAGDPYAVLGIAQDASDEEVEQAYRRMISEYHPDRLASAARELRELAEVRAREINAAYETIKQLRRHAG
jgi:preprotein translocase subunit Sec63